MYDLFYRNPRLLVLAVLLIVVAGAAAYRTLPRMEDPEADVRAAYVFTRFPGADAQRVESMVTEPVERKLREAEHVKTVNSASRPGMSHIEVILTDEVTNINDAWSRVRDKLTEAELPAGATAPLFVDSEWASNTMIVAVTWEMDRPINHSIVTRYAKQLQTLAKFVPGTQHARLYGEAAEEILIEVQPHAVTHLGLTPDKISRMVEFADAKVPAGTSRTAESNVLLQVTGEIDSISRLQRLPIAISESHGIVRLGDIAKIERTSADPPRNIALVGGKDCVVLALRMLPRFRIDRWSDDIRSLLSTFRQQLPRGVSLRIIYDQRQYTDARIAILTWSLCVGAVCVLVVALLMMGWRSMLPIGLALPLTILAVFAGMALVGIPLQQMSLTGLIIALGFLIDTPIIVVDEIRSRIMAGATPQQAVVASVQHLAAPLSGATLTTILAFTPLVLVPGPIGDYLGTLGATVILAISASFVLGLTVVPAIAGLQRTIFADSSLQLAEGITSPRLTATYAWCLQSVFSRPWLGIALSVAIALLGFGLATDLDEQFFPPAERDHIQAQLRLTPHASLIKTRVTAERARNVMLQHDEVEEVHWFIGTSLPKFYYNMLTRDEDSPHFAQAMICLRSSADHRRVVNELQDTLDAELPEAQFIVEQLEQGPPFVAPIALRLYGQDVDRLFVAGEAARKILSQVDDVTQTRATIEHGQPKLVYHVDEDEAKLLGLDPVNIAKQLESGMEGGMGGSLVEGTEELAVRVRFTENVRADLAMTASVHLASNEASATPSRHVPVTAIGTFDLVPEPATITRRNGRRCNIILGYIRAGVLPSKVLAEFKRRLAAEESALLASHEWEFGGEEAERNSAVRKLMAYGSVLMLLMVATLVWALRSFRLAAMIASVAILAAGLALGSLRLVGYPVGIMAIIGTMGMIGVAVNDSIIVLAALNEDNQSRRGDAASVCSVVIRSTRHVLSTTFTTVAGFTPLIIAGGAFWAPVGVVIAGGVLGATVLSLCYIPCAFLICVRLPRR